RRRRRFLQRPGEDSRRGLSRHQLHPRRAQLRAAGKKRPRRRRQDADDRDVEQRHVGAHLAVSGGHLQKGAPPRRRRPRDHPQGRRLLDGLALRRRNQALQLARRQPARAARALVSSAFQRRRRAGALPGAETLQQPEVSRPAQAVGHIGKRQERRRSDRVRGRGPAHSRHVRRRAGQARRGERDGRRVQGGELTLIARKTVIGGLLVLLLGLPAGKNSCAADKTRIAVTNFNLSFLPLGVALQRGFFKDEGLDVEVIRMNTPNTVAAMVTGEVGYTMLFGSVIRAALRGMPLRAAASLLDSPIYALIARPEFKSLKDL